MIKNRSQVKPFSSIAFNGLQPEDLIFFRTGNLISGKVFHLEGFERVVDSEIGVIAGKFTRTSDGTIVAQMVDGRRLRFSNSPESTPVQVETTAPDGNVQLTDIGRKYGRNINFHSRSGIRAALRAGVKPPAGVDLALLYQQVDGGGTTSEFGGIEAIEEFLDAGNDR